MTHLNDDRLIDLAEGVRADTAEPHLQSCHACRRQLDELRAAMAMAAEVNVPEPSPLFWNHFSARVRDAVAAEGAPRAATWIWWVTLTSGAIAAVIVAVGVSVYQPSMSKVPNTAAVAAVSPGDVDDTRALGAADEATISMMADLAGDNDLAAAREGGLAGLTSHVGGADDALGVLTEGERVELQRLLKEELGKS